MYIRSSNLKNSQLDINDAIQGFECSQVTFLIPNIKKIVMLSLTKMSKFFTSVLIMF